MTAVAADQFWDAIDEMFYIHPARNVFLGVLRYLRDLHERDATLCAHILSQRPTDIPPFRDWPSLLTEEAARPEDVNEATELVVLLVGPA
jgi:hypothetical protein